GGSTNTSGTGGSGGHTSVSAATACADYVSAYCAKVDECAPVLVEGAFGDVATGSMRLGLECPTAFDAPGTTSTPALVEDCAKALPNLSCGGLENNNPPAACKAMAGPLVDGTPCGDSGQCQHAFCKKTNGSTCGVCATRVPAGMPCAGGTLSN